MMHFLGGRQPAFAHALLTYRVRLDISCTYQPPSSTISLTGFRVALVSVILSLGDLLVLVAVASVGQSAATGIRTRTLRFSRHTDPPDTKRASAFVCLRRLSTYSSA